VAIYYGNPDLKPAIIHNYDIRAEWYPNPGELISLAAFYKDFYNPIEMFQIPAGTGWNYKPYNTEEAYSKGLELDIRKSLSSLQDVPFFGIFKDLTIVFNASVIKSEIHTSKPIARDSVRIMQGQSPYIVNLGLFYNNPEKGIMVNLNYNRIGDRIAFAGTPVNPHIWELARNSVDLTVDKKVGEHLHVKLGLKDFINNPVHYVGYFGANEDIRLTKLRYIPNTKMNFSLSWTF
jgi:outer membrane receptor protein involved in Fe transport